jgi:hypothetical protein
MSISQRDDGLAPVCPHTLAVRSRAAGQFRSSPLTVAAAHSRSLSAQARLSPSPLACCKSLPSFFAPAHSPRASPPIVASTCRPRRSSPTMLTFAARRREAQCPGLLPLSPLSSCRSCRACRKPPAAASWPRPVQWPAAEPPAARRSSPLSATAQARRPCPPGAPACHSPFQVISIGP